VKCSSGHFIGFGFKGKAVCCQIKREFKRIGIPFQNFHFTNQILDRKLPEVKRFRSFIDKTLQPRCSRSAYIFPPPQKKISEQNVERIIVFA